MGNNHTQTNISIDKVAINLLYHDGLHVTTIIQGKELTFLDPKYIGYSLVDEQLQIHSIDADNYIPAISECLKLHYDALLPEFRRIKELALKYTEATLQYEQISGAVADSVVTALKGAFALLQRKTTSQLESENETREKLGASYYKLIAEWVNSQGQILDVIQTTDEIKIADPLRDTLNECIRLKNQLSTMYQQMSGFYVSMQRNTIAVDI
ncbi:MAG: hypothetical protein ABIJ34_04645 [archaeon]